MTDFIIGQNGKAPTAQQGQAGGAAAPLDVTLENFEAEVIKASMNVPVLVDFHASWCQPCKQLAPVLEAAVAKAGGAVRLVKIDGDANPELMQMMRIQSYPTVLAFYQGQPVDGFAGVVPGSQIDQLIAKLVQMSGGQGAPMIDEAQMKALLEKGEELLAAGAIEQAQDLYGQILEAMPEAWGALAGLLKTFLAMGDTETVTQYLDALEDDAAKHPAILAIKTQVELAADAPDDAEQAAFVARLAADANDHEARFELAQAQFAKGQKEQAIDNLLAIMKADREWNDGAARLHLIKLFEAMGPTDPLTVKGRRALSSMLFS